MESESRDAGWTENHFSFSAQPLLLGSGERNQRISTPFYAAGIRQKKESALHIDCKRPAFSLTRWTVWRHLRLNGFVSYLSDGN